MPETSSTTERIIAAAETRMRDAGFHGVSFRDIASDVGIKSASVHHHFPTKEDLGAAVVTAYTDRFMQALGDPEDVERAPESLATLYIDAFRASFGEDRRMCLCGILSAEATSMPPAVGVAVREFFDRNLTWVEAVLERAGETGEEGHTKALRIVALLEGAMLLAHSLDDAEVFERIVSVLDEAPFAVKP